MKIGLPKFSDKHILRSDWKSKHKSTSILSSNIIKMSQSNPTGAQTTHECVKSTPRGGKLSLRVTERTCD